MEILFALSLKCPHCLESLMDSSVRIDNEPSIKLNIRHGGESSWIRLSSVWGSKTVQSGMNLMAGARSEFSCPHCERSLNVATVCGRCSSHLVEFSLTSGGKVSICSRKGCERHAIEIENVHEFLQLAAIPHPYAEALQPQSFSSVKGSRKTIFLDTYCPRCDHSLIQDSCVRLRVVNNNGEQGVLDLSPFMHVSTHRASVELFEGIEVADLACPHCESSLTLPDHLCNKCQAHLAALRIKTMGHVFEHEICMRKGCTNPDALDRDIKRHLLEETNEW